MRYPLVFCLLALPGCALEANPSSSASATADAGPPEPLATSSEDLSLFVSRRFTWTEGQPPTAMVAPSWGPCMLAVVGGQFDAQTSISLYVDPVDGVQKLFGSFAPGANGRLAAWCSQWQRFKGWGSHAIMGTPVQGSAAGVNSTYIPLWTPNSLCYVRGVAGRVNGFLDNAATFLLSGASTWTLEITGNPDPLFAQAGCFGFDAANRAVNISPDDGVSTNITRDTGITTSQALCGLTQITGTFSSPDSWGAVDPTNGEWFVGANGGVDVHYQCFYYQLP